MKRDTHTQRERERERERERTDADANEEERSVAVLEGGLVVSNLKEQQSHQESQEECLDGAHAGQHRIAPDCDCRSDLVFRGKSK